MKKSFIKNVFRTIGSSFGRYIALICIVMLGVIFFVGLKISTVDMIDSANDFYNESNLYDFSLVSSVGFDTTDVFELRKTSQAYNVEGAYYQDMIVSDHLKSGYVTRFHSLTEEINKLTVIEGRLPETPEECVVDARYCDSSYIGQKITVSNQNSKEALDNMVYKEFTVTGLVDSPLYLSYQRGTTSVGDGSLESFMYVNFECFGVDYYTQIYIDVQNGYYVYEEDYEKLIEDLSEKMEGLSTEFSEVRYLRLSEELSDAKAEYFKALEEYESGLSEYTTSYEEYDSALKTLNMNKSQLEGMQTQYESVIKLKETYTDNNDQAALNMILGQIRYLEEAIYSLEMTIEITETQLNETKPVLDETKKALDEAYKLLEENSYLENEEIPSFAAYALTRDDNTGYSGYKDNADIVASIAYIFPIFFVLVAALVCVTTMSRMIEDERTQIGIFKALGYSKITIFSKYIFYSLSASVIGAVLGFYIGSYLFPTVIWKAYMMMYTYTDSLNIIHDYSLFIVSLLVSVIVLVGSTIITCYKVLSETPAEMIRPKAPEPGKRILLERITFIWNRLPFLHKVSLRNCFRYKKRFFMMLLGIAGCTSLLVIGFGLQDSISSVCDNQYDRVETYDYLVSVKEDMTEQEISSIVTELESFDIDSISVSMTSADVEFNNKKKSLTLVACEEIEMLSGYINILNDGKAIDTDSQDECIISNNLADSLKVSKGDKVKISFDNLREKEFVVAGIYDNYVNNYIIMTNDGYTSGCSRIPYQNCILTKDLADAEPYEMVSKLGNIKNVVAVNSTELSAEYFNEIVKSLNGIVVLVIALSGILAFVVLFNLNNINIMERVREIATIKVLGFYKGEAASYVFRENLLLTVLGTVLGLPLGYVLHGIVMSKIKVDMICFDIHVDPSSYMLSAAFTLMFAVLVELFMRTKISAVNMSESLKSIE